MIDCHETETERNKRVLINIDTSLELSDNDKAVLRVLAGDPVLAAAVPPAKKTAAAPPAKKAAAAPPKAATEPTPEPTPAADGDDTPEQDALRDAALARATHLLASGGRQKLVDALAGPGAGAEGVSKVAPENLQAFLDAISD